MQEHRDAPSLWSIRGVLPFFSIAFLNAFNDLGHKIVVQNTVFKVYEGSTLVIYTAVIQALILLPFLTFFTPAGFLSDKFAKDKVIRWATFSSIPVAAAILVCYYQGWFQAALWLTLLLATQAAIYSPSKYGFVKELVGTRNLAPANSVIQGLTIVAILGGTLIYTLVFEHFYISGTRDPALILPQIRIAGWLLLAGCVVEWLLSFRVPRVGKDDPELRFSWGHYIKTGYLRDNLRDAWVNPAIRQSIIGLSLFFAVNQVLIASFGAHLKEVTGEENTTIINSILGVAAIGIAIGATYAARMSRNFIETGLIPLGAAGISVLLFLLPNLTNPWLLGLLFAGFGFFGGVFLVPLNSLIQYNTRENTAGHILASNNFIQTIVMLAFLAATAGLSKIGVSQQTIFLGLAVISLIGSVWAVRTLPQSMIRQLVRGVLASRYSLDVRGLERIPPEGGVLFLGNHISFLDWAFLQMACPRPIRFVMHRSYYEKWYLKWLLDRLGIIPITSGGAATALSAVKAALEKGEAVALFPEGHITRNGHLSSFRPGFEKALAGTGAQVVPFYIQGLWGSRYSHAAGRYRESVRGQGSRTITVAFGATMPDTADAAQVKSEVQELSIEAWESHIRTMRPIASSWLRTAKRVGSAPALLGHDGQNFSGTRLLAAVLAFSRALGRITRGEERVGILLPASSGGVIANLACLVRGKTVVNLNYTQPAAVLVACARKAGLKTVITSKQFATKLQGKGFDLAPLAAECTMVHLEDVKESISKGSFVWQLLRAFWLPAWWLELVDFKRVRLDDTAAILFSSGSEGTPKGVELSHFNIVGNLRQTSSVLNPDSDDIMLSALPLFHAFGLTITTIMPLVEGIPFVTQPDPTDARTVGRLAAEHRVSILCGTSTFLRMYATSKHVHPLMLRHLRLVVAGAEKLRPEVRQAFKERFGHDIFEGYGTTETTPVASVNIPDALLDDWSTVQVGHKPGTVGQPLPGSQFRIVDPDTLAELPVGEAGLVLIGGSQIMKGYLDDPERTATAIAVIDGKRWYRSGDKGKIDADGFLQIVDRYSRFAKLGGEMVSLGSVEQALAASGVLEGIEFLVTSIPDPGKGERIALLYAAGGIALSPEDAREKMRAAGLPPLQQPSACFPVTEIPRLGSGKADYGRAKEVARTLAEGIA